MLEYLKEHFRRNFWLHIQATYTVFMCALFSILTVNTDYLLLLLVSTYSATILFGIRKDTSDSFLSWLPSVILIGIVPTVFGINFVNNLVTMLLMIIFNNYYYRKHRIRATDYDSSINNYSTYQNESISEIKRKNRKSKIDKLLDSDI